MRIAVVLGLVIVAGFMRPDVAQADATPYPFPLVQTGPGLTLHKEMYVLPVTYAEAYHGQHTEVIFQLSAKHRIFGSRFYFAYSQISFWQAYDFENSAPFRETNYNPELFYRFKETPRGTGAAGMDAGFEHESNGQPVPASRSWNLLYLAPYLRTADWLFYVKLRYRIPEEDKTSPDQVSGDDNPDITDYLGWSDLHFQYRFANNQFIHLQVRGWIGTGKGNVSLNWSPPLHGAKDTFFLVRFFHGYGESLIDYDRTITRVGAGLMFNR
jgi:phospholipase A1